MSWVKLHRAELTRSLIKDHPHAFRLLSWISLNADRRAGSSLKIGRGTLDLTHSQYRHAIKVLSDLKLVRFESSNSGTTAALTSGHVYQIDPEFDPNHDTPSDTPSDTLHDTPNDTPLLPGEGELMGAGAGSALFNNTPSNTRPNTTNDTPSDTNTRSNKKDKNRDLGHLTRFAEFWSAYPRKVKKATAKASFLKLDPDDQAKAVTDVLRRPALDPQWQDQRYIPHPSTYLNQALWDDEWEAPGHAPTIPRVAI